MANIFKNIQNLKNLKDFSLYKTSKKYDGSKTSIIAFSCSAGEGTLTKNLTEKFLEAKDEKGFKPKEWFEENAQFGQTEKVDTETGEVSTIFCLFCKPSRDEIMSW